MGRRAENFQLVTSALGTPDTLQKKGFAVYVTGRGSHLKVSPKEGVFVTDDYGVVTRRHGHDHPDGYLHAFRDADLRKVIEYAREKRSLNGPRATQE